MCKIAFVLGLVFTFSEALPVGELQPKQLVGRFRRAVFDTIPTLDDRPLPGGQRSSDSQTGKHPGAKCPCIDDGPKTRCFYDSNLLCRKSAGSFRIDDQKNTDLLAEAAVFFRNDNMVKKTRKRKMRHMFKKWMKRQRALFENLH